MEKLIRNALYRVVFWRIVGDVFSSARTLFVAVMNFCAGLERAAWLVETEAARAYYSSTGIDCGASIAEPGRYRGLREQVANENHLAEMDQAEQD